MFAKKPKSYKVFVELPRTGEMIEIFNGETLEEAEKYAGKNIKYFPRLKIQGGLKKMFGQEGGYYEEIVENPGYVDRSRPIMPCLKIGKMKKKAPFQHHIIYEDEKKVCFLVRFKKRQVRVCTIDIEFKDKIQELLIQTRFDWKVKIYRSALPIVYTRLRSGKHITIMEIVTGSPPSGYMIFKDNNPYNYLRENIVRAKTCPFRKYEPGVSGYYGVVPRGEYFIGLVRSNNKHYYIQRDKDPVKVAKEVDRLCMQLYGPTGCRNFTYEYYLAFEPEYLRNDKKRF